MLLTLWVRRTECVAPMFSACWATIADPEHVCFKRERDTHNPTCTEGTSSIGLLLIIVVLDPQVRWGRCI